MSTYPNSNYTTFASEIIGYNIKGSIFDSYDGDNYLINEDMYYEDMHGNFKPIRELVFKITNYSNESISSIGNFKIAPQILGDFHNLIHDSFNEFSIKALSLEVEGISGKIYPTEDNIYGGADFDTHHQIFEVNGAGINPNTTNSNNGYLICKLRYTVLNTYLNITGTEFRQPELRLIAGNWDDPNAARVSYGFDNSTNPNSTSETSIDLLYGKTHLDFNEYFGHNVDGHFTITSWGIKDIHHTTPKEDKVYFTDATYSFYEYSKQLIGKWTLNADLKKDLYNGQVDDVSTVTKKWTPHNNQKFLNLDSSASAFKMISLLGERQNNNAWTHYGDGRYTIRTERTTNVNHSQDQISLLNNNQSLMNDEVSVTTGTEISLFKYYDSFINNNTANVEVDIFEFEPLYVPSSSNNDTPPRMPHKFNIEVDLEGYIKASKNNVYLSEFESDIDRVAPSVPTGIVVGKTSTSLTYSWDVAPDDNSGIKSYPKVLQDADGNNVSSWSYGLSTSKAYTGLDPYELYTLKIRTKDVYDNTSDYVYKTTRTLHDYKTITVQDKSIDPSVYTKKIFWKLASAANETEAVLDGNNEFTIPYNNGELIDFRFEFDFTGTWESHFDSVVMAEIRNWNETIQYAITSSTNNSSSMILNLQNFDKNKNQLYLNLTAAQKGLPLE